MAEGVRDCVPPGCAARHTGITRELTTGLPAKDASFRLIVSGNIGVKEIERLIQKLEIDKDILADQAEEAEMNRLMGKDQ